MSWDAEAYIRLLDETPQQRLRRSRRGWHVVAPRTLAWKTALLAITTLAFVPVLLSKSAMAAGIYIAALVAVHVIGLVAIVAGSKAIWADKRNLAWRLAGIGVLAVLLSIVGKGLTGTTGALFWATLGLVWLLHSAGAVLFHLRGDPRACPFV